MNNSRGSHEEDVDVRDYDDNLAEGDYQDDGQGDEGSECNISNEDLDQIAVKYTKNRISWTLSRRYMLKLMKRMSEQ